MKNYSNESSDKTPLIIVAGPTAVGKTATVIELANALNGEIVSADSMQIYRAMPIGTAQPTAAERQAAIHHLVDFVDPADSYSVAQYAKQARAAIADIIRRGRRPIVSGGTGLYIHSLIYDLDFCKVERNLTIRRQLSELLATRGSAALHEMLKQRDSAAAARIHPNNGQRLMRALEIVLAEGNIGQFAAEQPRNSLYDVKLFVLTRPRQLLYERINKRVDLMLQNGLVDEVQALLQRGLSDANQAMKGIGYKEVYKFLNKQIDYAEMVNLLKRNSRRYAKRQLTWFRRYHFADWIDLSGRNQSAFVVKYIKGVI